jgi:hypothetical protein
MQPFKYASRFKYAIFGKNARVQDLLLEHVVNHHLAWILKYFAFGFEVDCSDLDLKMVQTIS